MSLRGFYLTLYSRSLLWAVSFTLGLSLCACGGGGGGGGTPAPSLPPASPLTASPLTLNFSNVGSNFSQQFSATTTDGPISIAASSTCTLGNMATVMPQSGPSGTNFSVTPIVAGACAISVVDAAGHSVTISINIASTIITGS